MQKVLTRQKIKPAVLAAIMASIEAYGAAEKKEYRIHKIHEGRQISLWKIAGLFEAMAARDLNRNLL